MSVLGRQNFSSLCSSLSGNAITMTCFRVFVIMPLLCIVTVTTAMVESWIEEEKEEMNSDMFERTSKYSYCYVFVY